MNQINSESALVIARRAWPKMYTGKYARRPWDEIGEEAQMDWVRFVQVVVEELLLEPSLINFVPL